MLGHKGVSTVDDLHVWAVSLGVWSFCARVLVGVEDDGHAIRRELERLPRDGNDFEHATLQVGHANQKLLSIEPVPLRLGTPTGERP